MPDSVTVAIIVEPAAAERILELADHVHVWAIDTTENRRAAEQVWRHRQGTTHLLSMTVFQFENGDSPDRIVASELDAIDLHHGERSQVPPWSRALVFGSPATPSLTSEFLRLGFDVITETDTGFTAKRSESAG